MLKKFKWVMGVVVLICLAGVGIWAYLTAREFEASKEKERVSFQVAMREQDKRRAESASKFKTMTPAQHLAAAKAFKLQKGTPINLEIFTQLDAIPKDAPEFRETEAVRKQANEILADFAEQNDLKNNPVKIMQSAWSAGGFGTVGIWKVTFKNRSDKPIGNIRYETTYSAETGKQVSTGSGLIQKVLPPNSQRTLEINDGFISSEAHKARIQITKWEFVQDAR